MNKTNTVSRGCKNPDEWVSSCCEAPAMGEVSAMGAGGEMFGRCSCCKEMSDFFRFADLESEEEILADSLCDAVREAKAQGWNDCDSCNEYETEKAKGPIDSHGLRCWCDTLSDSLAGAINRGFAVNRGPLLVMAISAQKSWESGGWKNI